MTYPPKREPFISPALLEPCSCGGVVLSEEDVEALRFAIYELEPADWEQGETAQLARAFAQVARRLIRANKEGK